MSYNSEQVRKRTRTKVASDFVDTPPDWKVGTWYNDGDRVSYQGQVYVCVMPHTAAPNWTPDIATSLWKGTPSDWPDWQVGTWYSDGDRVSYQGQVYVCVMPHTAAPNWTPDKATSLWELTGRTIMTAHEKDFIRHPKAVSHKPRHGAINFPRSRAAIAESEGKIEGNLQYGIESGKFFPATQGGLIDKDAPDDVRNIAPPEDGKIASAGQRGATYLDSMNVDWKKHIVYAGEYVDFVWNFEAEHKYRRFNYFITRVGWDPTQPLSRAQFEPEPFFTYLNPLQPYWGWGDEAMWPGDPTEHHVLLPQREGYQVILAVWEIAETDKGFYQVVDFNFLPGEGTPDRPEPPPGFELDGPPTYQSVGLKWRLSSGPHPVESYIIKRDGEEIASLSKTATRYSDENVLPLKRYQYSILAVDAEGNRSLESGPITVTTPGEDGDNSPPAAPTGLHSMVVTASSVELMWSAPSSDTPLASYRIYREGLKVGEVSHSVREFKDLNLAAATRYRYFVTAMGANGQESAPSAVCEVLTAEDEGGQYPAWQVGVLYERNTIASNLGKNWMCRQKHTSIKDWEPGVEGGDWITLWLEV